MPIINKAIPDMPKGASGFARYIAIIWQVLVIFGGLAVLLWIIWGALDWIMAGGNAERLKSAKDKISNGILGLAILVLSFLIVKLISAITGLNILNPDWPTFK